MNEKILKKLSQIQKKEKESSKNIYDICQKHQKASCKICITCKADICSQCEKDHINHYMIKQEEIMPNIEEIKKLQFGILNYINDFTELINYIKKWIDEINIKILELENNNKNNIIINSIDFIKNYHNTKRSLHSTIEFRKIYSLIIEPENKDKNMKILSFLNEDNFISKQNNIYQYNNYNITYEYNYYLAIKYLLKDINNYKDNFIKKSKKIIEYLFKNINNNNNLENANNKEINKIIDYSKLNKPYLFKPNNNNNKNKNQLVPLDSEKIHFLKARNIQQDINRISIENKFNKTYDNFSSLNNTLKKTHSVKDNESTKSNISNGSTKDVIYSKKNKNIINKIEVTPNLNHNNRERNLVAISSNNLNDNKNIHTKYHSLKDINPKKLFSNSLKSNQNLNNQQNINNEKANYINSMADLEKINNYIKGKTYIHKKFILNQNKLSNNINNIILNKLEKNIFIQNENSIDNKYTNIYIKTDSKIDINKSPSNINNHSETKNSNIIDIPITFSNNNNNSSYIVSSIFNKNIKPFQMEDKINKVNDETYINTNNTTNNTIVKDNKENKYISHNNKYINNNFYINIIKPIKYEFIKIKNNTKINIGIDLGNIETKISVLNNYNEIQLMCFSDNKYSIPTIVSFNNNEIIIGSQTEELMINNPSQTIFNIIKIFGHKYDEIINSTNNTYLLWPFKIYKDDNNKPYIKIKKKEGENIYYFEQILVIFLKKLFDLLFSKISIENININNNNRETSLNLTLIISVPNCFTFYQRKLLEQIFFSEIFPKNNNSIYGGYKIILDKIGIEDRTSIASLCLKNKPKIKNNNILIINLDTCSVDISIISIYDNIKKVVAVDNIELINENFIDNFISLCLKILKENNINIPKEFLYSESLLSKIRNISSNIIKNLIIKEEVIFIIDNLKNGNGNCVLKINRIDYDKVCFELCKKIIILIKNTIKKAKLTENDINDIILIGEGINMNKLNQMIKELFINNKTIYDKLSISNNSNINNDNKSFFIVAGATLLAYNLNNQPFFIFRNICPNNIGIESYNGYFDIIVEKNSELPLNVKKIIKIKNNESNAIIINIYEGKEKIAVKNKFISRFIFDKYEFKDIEKINKKEFLEISIEFEIDINLNIKFYINDSKTCNHLFKCEINVEKIEKKA